MVKAYIAKYGGNASDINADVAGGYSVGEMRRPRPPRPRAWATPR